METNESNTLSFKTETIVSLSDIEQSGVIGGNTITDDPDSQNLFCWLFSAVIPDNCHTKLTCPEDNDCSSNVSLQMSPAC